MIGFDTVLYAASAFSVSGRGALLLLLTLSLTQLFACVTRLLWSWWGLSHGTNASVLTAIAFGGALWQCFASIDEQNATDLGPLLPLLVVFVLCGISADRSLSWRRFFKASVFLLLIGCVRELLSTASLFSFPLGYTAVGTVFGRSTDGSVGVGGVLLTALAAWLFGASASIKIVPSLPKRAVLFIGLLTAAVGCVIVLFPALSTLWRFFIVTMAAVWLGFSFSAPYFEWLVLLSASAVCLPPTLTLTTAIVTGGGTALLAVALPSIINRLGRAPLPRRFSGAPLCLTLFAIVLAIGGAI